MQATEIFDVQPRARLRAAGWVGAASAALPLRPDSMPPSDPFVMCDVQLSRWRKK
jgi:hypothetical protein